MSFRLIEHERTLELVRPCKIIEYASQLLSISIMKHEDVPGLYSDGEDFGIWEPKRIDGYFILSESILQRVIHPRTQILILGSRENIIRVKRKDRIFLNHQLGNAGLRYYNLSMAIKEYEKLQSSDKVSFLVVN